MLISFTVVVCSIFELFVHLIVGLNMTFEVFISYVTCWRNISPTIICSQRIIKLG